MQLNDYIHLRLTGASNRMYLIQETHNINKFIKLGRQTHVFMSAAHTKESGRNEFVPSVASHLKV